MSNIDHPPHYQPPNGIEVIDIIEAYNLDFILGNVIKYTLRAGHKDGNSTTQDLQKAKWYLTRAIKKLQAQQGCDNNGNQNP